MKDSLLQIRTLINHVIVALIVELYLYEDEYAPVINDIELTFDNGASFVISCSGDGGIFIRKGKAKVDPNLDGVRRAELIQHDCCVGLKMNGVNKTDNSLVFNIDGNKLVFLNDDDELVMKLNNHEVKVSF